MFTDWTQVNPRYFYLRGAIFGIIITVYFFAIIMPALRYLVFRYRVHKIKRGYLKKWQKRELS